MRILLIAVGTRGDVQPFLALSKTLKARGHSPTLVAGENFRAWIEGEGIAFEDAGVDFEALMNSPEGLALSGKVSKNPLNDAKGMRRITAVHGAKMAARFWELGQGYDAYLSGLISFPLVEAMAERTGRPHVSLLLAPFFPTADPRSAILAPIKAGASALNRWVGELTLYGLWWIFGPTTQAFRAQIGLPPSGYLDFVRQVKGRPHLGGYSPLLAPHIQQGREDVVVTGSWRLEESAPWTPPPALVEFLEAGPPPVYVGFGSMSQEDPDATLRLIVEAIERAGVRGVVSKGWARIEATALPESIYLLGAAPHGWLFPRMAGAVHHGGAGTTEASLRAGIPTAVIPHLIDQPYWGRRVHALGLGPAPRIRRDLDAEGLAASIRALADPDTQARARAFGPQLAAEDGLSAAARELERLLA